MKLKNILLIALAFVLGASVAIGGTIAYLTDSDSAVNVMTVGDVMIEQYEKDRNGADFVQGQKLFPYVTLGDVEKDTINVNGYEIEIRTQDSVGNYMDKIVTVKNTGDSDAYVRTLIAIPAALENTDASENILHWNAVSDTDTNPGNGWYWNVEENEEWDAKLYTTITVDNIDYNVYVATNVNVIKSGESTAPSLVGAYLDARVDYDDENGCYTFNGEKIDYDLSDIKILVATQAVQVAGFEKYGADVALDTAFGEITATNNPWKKAAEDNLSKALAVVAAGGEVTLDKDVSSTSYNVGSDDHVTINLNNNKLDGSIINHGALSVIDGTLNCSTYGLENFGTVSFTNVDVNAGDNSNYAIINRGDATYDDVNLVSKGGGVGVTSGAQVTFDGGIVAVNTASTSGRYAFYIVGEGSVLTINDGEFSFSSTLNQKRAYIYAGAGATVYVNGGNFGPASTRDGYTAGILGDGTVIIKGGTFGFDPSTWVAEGYEAVESNGVWTVSAK